MFGAGLPIKYSTLVPKGGRKKEAAFPCRAASNTFFPWSVKIVILFEFIYIVLMLWARKETVKQELVLCKGADPMGPVILESL